MINLPNRCQRLISRAEWHTVRLKGASGESEGLRRYDKENLLWQSTVAIRSDPVGSLLVQGWKATPLDNARKFHLKFTVADPVGSFFVEPHGLPLFFADPLDITIWGQSSIALWTCDAVANMVSYCS